MHYCPDCGEKLRNGGNFCHSCGSSLTKPATGESTTEKSNDEESMIEGSAIKKLSGEEPTSKGTNTWDTDSTENKRKNESKSQLGTILGGLVIFGIGVFLGDIGLEGAYIIRVLGMVVILTGIYKTLLFMMGGD